MRRKSPVKVRIPGSQRALATKMPAVAAPDRGAENMAVVVAFVLMVRVSVTGPLPEAMVMLAGAKLHETLAGNVPQEKPTVPVYPPLGVSVMVKVPDCPATMVRLEGLTAVVMPTATTVSVTAAEVLCADVVSPPYTAMRLYVPAALNEVVMKALPDPFKVPVPRLAVPFKNVTVPVGTPVALDTDAVRVTVMPVPADGLDDESVVVVVKSGGGSSDSAKRHCLRRAGCVIADRDACR